MASFDQIRTAFESAKQRNLVPEDMDLREFSRLGNQVTGTNAFDAGDVGFIGQAAAGVDRFIRGVATDTGLRDLTQGVGGFIGEGLFDNRQLGEEVGSQVSEGLIASLPAIAGIAAAPFTGGSSLAVTGAALTGGLTAAQVSADTGDPVRSGAAGAFAAFAPAAVGKAIGVAGQGATRASNNLFGNSFTQGVTNVLARPVPGTVARTVPGVAASFGVDVGADIVDIGLAEERTLAELTDPQYWQARVIGQGAFLPIDVQQAAIATRNAAKAARGETVTAGQVNQAQQVKDIKDWVQGLDEPEPTPTKSVQDEPTQDFDSFFDQAVLEEPRAQDETPFVPQNTEHVPAADTRPLDSTTYNRLPESASELSQQVQQLNRSRIGRALPQLDDAELAGKVLNKVKKDGRDLGEAQQRTIQEEQNKLLLSEEQLTDETVVAAVEEQFGQSVSNRVDALLKSKNRDDTLVDDIATLLTSYGETVPSQERINKDFKNIRTRAERRAKQTPEDTKKKKGRPSKVDEGTVVVDDIVEQINALEPEVAEGVWQAYINFSESIEGVDVIGAVNVPERFYSAVDVWLKGKKQDLPSLKAILSGRADKARKDALKQKKETNFASNEDADFLDSREGYRQWDEENGSFEAMLTPRGLAEKLLLRQGHTPNNALELGPVVENLGRAFESLTGERLQIGTVIDPEGRIAGLSSRSEVQTAIFANPALRKQTAQFATLHEAAHQFQKAYGLGILEPQAARSYEQALKFVADAALQDPRELGNFLVSYARDVLPKKTLNDVESALIDTAGDPSEAMANFLGLSMWDSLTKADPYKQLRFLPQPLARALVEVIRFVRDLVKGTKSLFDYRKYRGEIGDEAWTQMRGLEKSFSRRTKMVQDQWERDARNFSRLGLLMPGEAGRYRSDAVVDGSELTFKGNRAEEIAADAMLLPGTKTGKKLLSAVADFFDPLLHRAFRHPELVRAAQAVIEESPHSHAVLRSYMGMLYGKKDAQGNFRVTDLGQPVLEKGGPLVEMMHDPKLRNAFSDVLRASNVTRQSLAQLQSRDPQQFASLTQGLNQKQIALLVENQSRFNAALRKAQKDIIDGRREQGMWHLARIMKDRASGSMADVEAQARQLYAAFEQGKQQGNLQGFDTLASQMGQDIGVLTNFLDPLTDGISQIAKVFRDNPYYTSESRFKRYHVAYDNGSKQTGRVSFSSVEEAITAVEELKSKGHKLFYPGGFKDMQKNGRSEMHVIDEAVDLAEQKTLRRAVENMRNQGQITQGSFDAIVDSIDEFKSAIDASGLTNDVTEAGPGRRFAPGRETLDMVDQHMTWLGKVSRAVPAMVTDARLRYEGSNPAIAADHKNVRMYEQIQKAKNNFRKPDPRIGNALVKGSFMWNLAWNTSSGLIEAASWPMTLSPMLVEEGAGMAKSYTLPVKMAAKLAKRYATGSSLNSGVKVRAKNGKMVDAHDALLADMERSRLRGRGRQAEQVEEIYRTQEDMSRLAEGKEPLGTKLTTPFRAFMETGAKLYGGFATVNSDIGFLSAFELKREQLFGGKKNLTREEFKKLSDESFRIWQLTNNAIGRAGRPVGLFSNEGAWRTPGQAIYSLQSFNSAQMSNWFRRVLKGVPGTETASRFSKAEQRQARKAALQSFLTLSAAAGVVGAVPFLGAFLTIIEESTDINVEEEVRLAAASLADDEEGGAFMADLATHGLAYAAGADFDLSGRVAMSGMAGFNDFEGWSLKSLIGPSAGIASDFTKGAESFYRGDANGVLENTLPRAFRNLYKGFRDEGTVRTANGRLLYRPTESERFGIALGFLPSSLSEIREKQRIQTKSEQVNRDQKVRDTKEVAQVYQQQGPQAAQARMVELVRENPGRSLSAMQSALVQWLNQERFGYDPSRDGTAETALAQRAVGQTFQNRVPDQVTELQRGLAGVQTQLSLGNAGLDIGSVLRQAILVDQLQNRTGLNRSAASLLAGQLTRQPDPNLLPTVQAFLGE